MEAIPLSGKHTIHTSVVWLNMSGLDLSVLDDQGVTLGTILTEDCGALEGELEILGELAGRIAEETDL